MFYSLVVKPILFSLDPESAHHLSMSILNNSLFSSVLIPSAGKSEMQPITLDGLTFKNPIGLAAGFDKDGKYYRTMSKFGFGFIEIGTVTPRPQIGNPKPRLFRLPTDEALINRMGFNNDGVDAMVQRLSADDKIDGLILGGNIGKNKDTINEDAHKDYLLCFEKLYNLVDYFTVNVSSPNTPGLRSLQNKESLEKILGELQMKNHNRKPIYLKIAPDLEYSQIDEIIKVISNSDISGIITNNTSISRENLKTKPEEIQKIGNGGLSGKPIEKKSNEILSYITSGFQNNKTIIASGGVSSVSSVKEKLNKGAKLVQIYTGLIYQGPSFVKSILNSTRNTPKLPTVNI